MIKKSLLSSKRVTMSQIIKYFQTLTQIPHCSKEAKKLLDFLVNFAKCRGYNVEVDELENIFISKGTPTLSLQAHYDMVCMGRAPKIETYIKDGWMRAKESSLGADNGMAIAMMMQLMDEGRELEFLLTSDEEIGLIGANGVAFEIKSRYMLNLDSEDEAEVYIGCAGGVDIIATIEDSYIEGEGECYEVAVKGLVGGHSGVDIDKGIVSAIKELGNYLYAQNITQLATIYGGERRNSIAANAVAVVYATKPLESSKMVKVRKLTEKPLVLADSTKIIELIHRFKHGVRAENSQFNIPDISINLAIITTDEKGGLTIETSARAMSAEGLEEISKETVALFEEYGFGIKM
jgi:dipeptidase D